MNVKKISEKQFVLDCVNEEFRIIGSDIHFNSFEDLVEYGKQNSKWFDSYSFTKAEYEQWKEYFMNHIYDWKPKSTPKYQIKHWFPMFALNYGFIVREDDKSI